MTLDLVKNHHLLPRSLPFQEGPKGVKWELRFAGSGVSLRFSVGGELVFTGGQYFLNWSSLDGQTIQTNSTWSIFPEPSAVSETPA